MRTTCAVALLALIALSVNAQDKRADIRAYGDSNLEVAAKACDKLGLKIRWHGVDTAMVDGPCWARIDGVSRAEAALILPEAFPCLAVLDDAAGTLTFYSLGEVAPGAKVKGYDVSIACGRFVSYVNTYGGLKRQPLEGEDSSAERTAAQHLADLLSGLLYSPRELVFSASVVGERLLYTLDANSHAAVREALDLLIAEGGGESAALKADRAMAEKLKSKKVTVQAEETPVASLFADICTQAGVGMVLGYSLAAHAGALHANLDLKDLSAWDALHVVADLAGADDDPGGDDDPIEISVLAGAVRIDFSNFQAAGYRVYEVTDLLRKLDAAYARQRTQPGLEDGNEGSLVAEGGVNVVVYAIEEQLAELGYGDGASVYAYGDRVIVRGSIAGIDAATTILKEMGWEE